MKNLMYLLVCFLLMVNPAISAVKDSIGIEKKNGKTFVKHKVDPKETIYALSRKYGATVAEIKEANPGVDFASLNIGEIVSIPTKSAAPATKTAETKTQEATPQPKAQPQQSGGSAKIHKVQPKETLFSLSQKYNVSVDELKKANPEVSKGLQVGMELSIPQKGNNVAQAKPTTSSGKTEKFEVEEAPAKQETVKATETVKKEEPAKKEVAVVKKEEPKETAVVKTSAPAATTVKAEPAVAKTESTPVKKANVPAEIPVSNNKIEKVKEAGLAEEAKDRSEGPDFFALHKTAPVGTIIQVMNEENNQTAFVRVVGTSSSSSIIELSPKAMQRLSAKGDKVKVSLSYFKP